MSMTLRFASTGLFGVPPLFRKRAAAPAVKVGVTKLDPRIEPRVAPAVKREAVEPAGFDFDKLLAATRKAPVELAPIEWEGDKRDGARLGEGTGTRPVYDHDPRGNDARLSRIRDRYISARFPGVARGAADLESSERVIKAARLYFEDGQSDTALELLDVAIEQDSRSEALWLAQLEILFLGRDAARYVECARAFRALHPASAAWAEVSRLGRALAPGQALFGAASGPRDHDHYGPWPDLPNWIQANWDLTGEVVAADFHRILRRRCEVACAKPQLAA
ncbi:MAG: hypothetical protein ABI789_03330 [Usitatibacter sp.]